MTGRPIYLKGKTGRLYCRKENKLCIKANETENV